MRRQKVGAVLNLEDLPPTPAYVLKVEALGAKVYARTRWMNGILLRATEEQLRAIERLDYVRHLSWVGPFYARDTVYKSRPGRAKIINPSTEGILNRKEHEMLGIRSDA